MNIPPIARITMNGRGVRTLAGTPLVLTELSHPVAELFGGAQDEYLRRIVSVVADRSQFDQIRWVFRGESETPGRVFVQIWMSEDYRPGDDPYVDYLIEVYELTELFARSGEVPQQFPVPPMPPAADVLA